MTNTTEVTLDEMQSGVNAFNAAKDAAKAQMIKGQVFKGAFQIADGLGFVRETLEWKCAVKGAMAHISTVEVWTDANGILV